MNTMKKFMNREAIVERTHPREGEINYNRFSTPMIIEKYHNVHDIDIKMINIHPNGNIYYSDKTHVRYEHFLKGKVLSPYDLTSQGIGFIGAGDYTIKKYEKYYKKWDGMINRCYNTNITNQLPLSEQSIIDPFFLEFQNFAAWCENNYYEIGNETMNLDKNLLFKGNNVYGPDMCCFLPQSLSNLIKNRLSNRGDCPLGVSYDPKSTNRPYRAGISVNGIYIKLGNYPTKEEAFEIYKCRKKEHMIKIANEYYYNKGGKDLPQFQKIYNAIKNYKIEITD